MKAREAEAMLAGAVPKSPGVWADFGAGTGMFTRALAQQLGTGSRVYAVDRDPDAVARLAEARWSNGVELIPLVGDFTKAVALPSLLSGGLDGMLFANSLHFVAKPDLVLARLTPLVRPGGSVVIIEYEGRQPDRWLPHPLPTDRLAQVVAQAGLGPPIVTARRPSAYGGDLYVSVTKRPS